MSALILVVPDTLKEATELIEPSIAALPVIVNA